MDDMGFSDQKGFCFHALHSLQAFFDTNIDRYVRYSYFTQMGVWSNFSSWITKKRVSLLVINDFSAAEGCWGYHLVCFLPVCWACIESNIKITYQRRLFLCSILTFIVFSRNHGSLFLQIPSYQVTNALSDPFLPWSITANVPGWFGDHWQWRCLW